ncbi:MAG TPA: hypothetical protein VIG08_03595 [Gemmatimonadales bacterium]|jgi:hypothetical protein
MRLTRDVAAAGLIGWLLVTGCPSETKDVEVRTYIENDLRPYLDSLAYQLCKLKNAQADPGSIPGRIICPGGPDGYKPPPPDGHP